MAREQHRSRIVFSLFAVLTVSLALSLPARAEEIPAENVDSAALAFKEFSLPPLSTSGVEPAASENLEAEPEVLKLSLVRSSTSSPSLFPRLDLPIGNPGAGDKLFTASLVTLAALNVADYLSTREALKYPCLREGNPLLKDVSKNALVFAGVKLGLVACDYLILKKIYKKNKTMGWVLSAVANVAMSYVVANNMKMIDRARSRY